MKNVKLADMSIEQLAVALNDALPEQYHADVVSGEALDDTVEVTREGDTNALYLSYGQDDCGAVYAALWDAVRPIIEGICWDATSATAKGVAADIVAKYL